MASTSSALAVGDGTAGPVEVLAGYTVGVLAADGCDDLAASLRDYGAEALHARIDEALPTRRIVDAIVAGTVDALVVLDAVSASELLAAMQRLRSGSELRAILRDNVVVTCPDNPTSAALSAAGIPVTVPGGAVGSRLDATAALLAEQVPLLRGRRCVAAGHDLDVRGQAVVIDQRLCRLPATAMALLRALAQQPGHVVSRERLLALLPGVGGTPTGEAGKGRVSGHAVDVAIGRLRTALGDPAIIATVVKRGYRLAVA
ncbi:MAG TPA: winged helix-turn-helix domain-containing protein [Jatrophihabitans sp.]|jgi:uroporphyrinogen-III synthase